MPIFVLTLARPEFDERRVGWGSGRRNGTTLALEPLGAPAMDAMLEGLVPQMPAPAKSAIAAEAQGIPLYAIETVRMLVDRGVVQPVEGSYQLVGEIGELAVPDTLQSLLAARLDALSPEARRLVSDAAVIGNTFPLEALVAVSGLPRPQVEGVLLGLVRREVISLRADPLSPERGQYAFVQTMFRQVAYDTLSRRERKSRHLAVSDHLARAFPDGGEEGERGDRQSPARRAGGRSGRSRRRRIRGRAADRNVRPGGRACRPHRGTENYCSFVRRRQGHSSRNGGRARMIWRPPGSLERAGEASMRAADYSAVTEQFGHAGELYRKLGLLRHAARADVGVASGLRRAGRNDEARQLVLEALVVLRDEPGPDTADGLHQLAVIAAMLGQDDAERLAGEALHLAQSLDLPDDVLAEMLTTRGIAEMIRGLYRQGAASLREAARLARGRQNHLGSGRALLNLSDGLAGVDVAASAEAAEDALDDLRRSGSSEFLSVTMGNYCGALIQLGRWDEVEELASGPEAEMFSLLATNSFYLLVMRAWRDGTVHEPSLARLKTVSESDDPQDQGVLWAAQAVAAACRDDEAGTLEYAREALRLAEPLGLNGEPTRWAWAVAADAALDLNDTAEAARLLDWLDGHPVGLVPRLLRAQSLRVRGRMLALAEDDSTGAVFEQATSALRDFGSPFYLAQALLDHAAWRRSVGEHGRAEQLAAEAWEIAGRLPSKPLFERAAVFLGDRQADVSPG